MNQPMTMTRVDRVELFRMAMMWSGSALVLGALLGLAVGIQIGRADE